MIGHWRRQADNTTLWVEEVFDLGTFAQRGVIQLPADTGAIDDHGNIVDTGTGVPSISGVMCLLIRLTNDKWYRVSRNGLTAYMHRIGQDWDDLEEM